MRCNFVAALAKIVFAEESKSEKQKYADFVRRAVYSGAYRRACAICNQSKSIRFL